MRTYPAYKRSGIEWLGEIPEHWKVVKLKFLLNQIEQGWSPQCENRQARIDEWGVLKVGCVNGKVFDETEHKTLPTNLEPQPRYEVRAGDLLMSRANTRELVGSVAVVGRGVRPRLMLCDKLYRLDLTDRLITAYAELVLKSNMVRFQLERSTSGASSSMQNISQKIVGDLKIPLPPKREQERIIDHLDRKTAQIDTLIRQYTGGLAVKLDADSGQSKGLLTLLLELRTALISEAVTGKIDVREDESVPA